MDQAVANQTIMGQTIVNWAIKSVASIKKKNKLFNKKSLNSVRAEKENW